MENIREEVFLGGNKVLVGNKYTDLVLETLGKVYVKTGNNSVVLSDILAMIDKTPESDIPGKSIIVHSDSEMGAMEYPGDGYFVYNTLTTTLYISYDLRYIQLIEASEGADDGYVRRKGDTMSGQLEITTPKSPLIVASSELVKNFNAEYIDGYTSGELAKKRVDEFIFGNWTFKGRGVSESNWTFKNNVRVYGDIVTSGSLSTPEFASGFAGYGWRLDADTNTLTVDYLVVRKAMKVFEMVINKISATNGAIWVTNSSKCSKAVQPIIIPKSALNALSNWDTTASDFKDTQNFALNLLKDGNYYAPLFIETKSDKNPINVSLVTLTKEVSKPSAINTTEKTFANIDFIIKINDAKGLVENKMFKGTQTLLNEDKLLTGNPDSFPIVNMRPELRKLQSCAALYYVTKERYVTQWDTSTGTVPREYGYRDAFNKDSSFFMIPKGIEPLSNTLYTTLYENAETFDKAWEYIVPIKTYYKYFAIPWDALEPAIDRADKEYNTEENESVALSVPVPNLWVVNTDEEEYPLFKPGDIIRCQKYADGNIKYYDALVSVQAESRQFIMLKATSVFDIYTEISYNEDGSIKSTKEEYNTTQYDKTEQYYNGNTGQTKPINGNAKEASSADPDTSPKKADSRGDDIAEKDDMIQVGNIQDVDRQNAIYLTSCDDDGPFIDIISGLNRPDYSVLYDIPIFLKKDTIFKKEWGGDDKRHNFYCEWAPWPPDMIGRPGGQVIMGNIPGYAYYTSECKPGISLLDNDKTKFRHSYTKTTKVRLGNLSGIYNEAFGNKQPYGFGLYGENVFLTGEFYLNNGKSVVNFSQEGIFLQFKNAGLQIRDASIGTEIYMNANKFIFDLGNDSNGKPVTMTFGKLYNKNTGKIEGGLLDVSGWIQANGLRIRNLQDGKLTCEITPAGKLYAYNADLIGSVRATMADIGGNIQILRELDYNANPSLFKYRYKYARTEIEVMDELHVPRRTIVNIFENPGDSDNTKLNSGVSFKKGYLPIISGMFSFSGHNLVASGYNTGFEGTTTIDNRGIFVAGSSANDTEDYGHVNLATGIGCRSIQFALPNLPNGGDLGALFPEPLYKYANIYCGIHDILGDTHSNYPNVPDSVGVYIQKVGIVSRSRTYGDIIQNNSLRLAETPGLFIYAGAGYATNGDYGSTHNYRRATAIKTYGDIEIDGRLIFLLPDGSLIPGLSNFKTYPPGVPSAGEINYEDYTDRPITIDLKNTRNLHVYRGIITGVN